MLLLFIIEEFITRQPSQGKCRNEARRKIRKERRTLKSTYYFEMGNVLSTRSNSEGGGVWADKVAVITGGGQGMGAKMGETLAKRGVKGLALADINAKKLEETAAYIARQLTDEERKHTLITTHVVDVSNRNQVFAFADDVVKIHKQCDCLLNNAGIVCANTTDNTTIEEWEHVLKVDLQSKTKKHVFFFCLIYSS